MIPILGVPQSVAVAVQVRQPSFSQSAGSMWAWLRMLRSVPTGMVRFFGTIAVSTTSPDRRTNLTWLPRWLVSTNPASSSLCLTSRNGCGLRRPNLDLDRANPGQTRRARGFEVKFQSLLQVCEGFFLCLALAGDIHLETLRNN